MFTRTRNILLVLVIFILAAAACGGAPSVETATPEPPQASKPSATPPPTETPTPAPSPTSEWSQYWVEVQDPYHSLRFAMPCFWQASFPSTDPTGSGAFAYPLQNYTDEYVLDFPRSDIPLEAGAIKIDLNFMSARGMRDLPPGTTQFDFVVALYSGNTETRLVTAQDVEINGQPALFVTTEGTFGLGSFYLFTVTDDLFLAFGATSERMDHPDVQGILNSISLSPETLVRIPEHKPAPPPDGLAAPCIPGY